MFDTPELSDDLAAIRESHVPGTLVVDAGSDFETLPPAIGENLLAVADSLDPLSYEVSWVPPDAPEALLRLAGGEFTVGAPGDGGVAWTRQTDPPTVLLKPRLEGSPERFVEFLLAEALLEAGLGLPETFLGFFEDDYRTLDEAVPLSPADTYQLGVALFDAYVGLRTRETFAGWEGEHDALYEEWVDAGERLEPRLSSLSRDVAVGRTDFADAAELACNAVKHDLELPTPFDALDAGAYRDNGSAFAVRWAEKTFEALE